MGYPVFYVPSGDVLPVMFDSYAGSTGASVTISGLAVTDIEIYKDGSTTQRASDAGYTLLDTDGIDFDGLTGIHGFSIDTGDNTDAGFYTVGAWFTVVVSAITVDSQTVSFIACQFRLMPAESVAGKPKVDTDTFGGSAGTFSSGRPEVNTTHAAGTAWGSGAITAASIAADAITAAKIADGAIDAATFAAGAITASAIAADAITDAKVAADVTIASVTGAVGSVTAAVTVGTNNDKTGYSLAADQAVNVTKISGSATAADNLEAGALGLVSSTCAAGSTTTSIVTNLTEATDDHYNGRVITFTSGALAGQSSSISDYNGTTKTLTIVAVTEAPANTDPFVIS